MEKPTCRIIIEIFCDKTKPRIITSVGEQPTEETIKEWLEGESDDDPKEETPADKRDMEMLKNRGFYT
jgi:hypothetical protein